MNGGDFSHVSIFTPGDEGGHLYEPVDLMTPDLQFEKDCAKALLARTLDRLAGEYAKPEQARVFEVLKLVLTEGKGVVRREKLAERLGMKEGAVYTASCRLRRRYREILEEEIAAPLSDPSQSQIEEEIRSLFEALSR